MRRRGKGPAAVVAAVAGIALLAAGTWLGLHSHFGAGPVPDAGRARPPRAAGLVRVERVVDGDTVILEGGQRLRVLGVNTPEKGEELYDAAARLAREMVEGREVAVRAPVQRRDSYRRLLGDVVVDGKSLREALLHAGLAHVMLIPPHDPGEAARLLEIEAGARSNRRGIWATRRFAGPLHVTSARVDGDGGCHARVANVSGRAIELAGWRIRAGGAVLLLTGATIEAGRTLLVRCGDERDRGEPAGQAVMKWPDGARAMRRGATVDVVAPDGRVVDSTAVR